MRAEGRFGVPFRVDSPLDPGGCRIFFAAGVRHHSIESKEIWSLRLTPSRTVLGMVVPAVAILLAVAETTEGCTLEETSKGATEVSEKTEVSARLPAEYTKLSFRSDTRAARTLVGLGGESFFA